MISRLCQDCVDGECLEAYPVDCIYEEKGRKDGERTLPNQLFINPIECIFCTACESACPWEAIFPLDEVPTAFKADVALNAITDEEPEKFVVATKEEKEKPSPEEVEANRRKWEQDVEQAG
ncbi:MAG: 4Fe-4S binding protein [Verrucomicrobiota bacterium]